MTGRPGYGPDPPTLHEPRLYGPLTQSTPPGSPWVASSGPVSSAGLAEQEAGLARVAALGAAAFLSLKRQDKSVPSGAWHIWESHAFWHYPESAPPPWNPDNSG